jgi:hypothetical protein
MQGTSIRDFVCGRLVCPVDPHITLNAIFAAIFGWIDLKFSGDSQVNLLFLLFSFLSSSSPFPQNLSLFIFMRQNTLEGGEVNDLGCIEAV